MKTQNPGQKVRTAVRSYLRAGYRVVPIPAGKKAPKFKGWQKLRLGESEIADYFSDGTNVGLLLGKASGGIVDVDLDAPEALAIAPAFLLSTDMIHGSAGKPGSHHWFMATKVAAPLKLCDLDGACLLEIRSSGQQTLVPPSTHPSGELLRWEDSGLPARVKIRALTSTVKRTAAAALLARHWPDQGRRNETALALAGMLLRAGWSPKSAATFIGAAARAAGDEEWKGRAAAAGSTQRRLDDDGKVTGSTRLRELVGDAEVTRVMEWLGLPDDASISPDRDHFTDLGNAGRFVKQHGCDVRFCHVWKKWLVFDGTRWAIDESGEVERRAKATVRKLYEEASQEMDDGLRKKLVEWARASEARGRITAMMELAKSEPQIPVSPLELDANPWVLNCLNGTIDLNAGELRQHRRDDLCTKIIPVAYDPEAACPLFKKFLRQILNNNTELINFLNRSVRWPSTSRTLQVRGLVRMVIQRREGRAQEIWA